MHRFILLAKPYLIALTLDLISMPFELPSFLLPKAIPRQSEGDHPFFLLPYLIAWLYPYTPIPLCT